MTRCLLFAVVYVVRCVCVFISNAFIVFIHVADVFSSFIYDAMSFICCSLCRAMCVRVWVVLYLFHPGGIPLTFIYCIYSQVKEIQYYLSCFAVIHQLRQHRVNICL